MLWPRVGWVYWRPQPSGTWQYCCVPGCPCAFILGCKVSSLLICHDQKGSHGQVLERPPVRLSACVVCMSPGAVFAGNPTSLAHNNIWCMLTPGKSKIALKKGMSPSPSRNTSAAICCRSWSMYKRTFSNCQNKRNEIAPALMYLPLKRLLTVVLL